MNTEITYTTVDTDALDFLKVIYFGVITILTKPPAREPTWI